jgi:hypothetical protein
MKKKTIFYLMFLLAESASAGASQVLGTVLKEFLCSLYAAMKGIIGPIAVFILIAAGVKWLWSQDDPGERKQAKYLIENVLIGLVVTIAAGGIVYAIISINPCT